ncbi:hypothetical protein [Actinoallomurus sp. NPDC050550]|uniref:hypothetical protein n=1 Tax=Actinoallomurus sp. NPDC050550 TaxID=3154937 RepID=UPI0033F5EF69
MLLLAGVTALATAATGRIRYARTRFAAVIGSIGFITLDTAALVGLTLTAPALAWPLALAAGASATRLALTARTLPRIISA